MPAKKKATAWAVALGVVSIVMVGVGIAFAQGGAPMAVGGSDIGQILVVVGTLSAGQFAAQIKIFKMYLGYLEKKDQRQADTMREVSEAIRQSAANQTQCNYPPARTPHP